MSISNNNHHHQEEMKVSSSRNQSDLGPIDHLVALRQINKGSSQASCTIYETINKPFPLGNANSIAYGGFCVCVAIAAAYQSLSKDSIEKLNIYSVQASFLGPTKLEAPVRLEVTSLRETRSFSTRMILVKQAQGQKDDQGNPIYRSTMAFLIDFVVTKKDRTISGMIYSDQPSVKVTDHTKLPTHQERLKNEVKKGRLDEGILNAINETTNVVQKIYQQKFTPEGILWDNLSGIKSDQKTKQDDRKMSKKVTFDWIKYLSENQSPNTFDQDALFPPSQKASAACFYGLILDGYLSFLPLVFSKRFLYDAEACSSLDLSLRFHVDDLRGDLWNLREMRTITGADERTYSQSRLWQKEEDRMGKGKGGSNEYKLIATMTQSSIMRGFENKQSHL